MVIGGEMTRENMAVRYRIATIISYILMFVFWSVVVMQSPFYIDDWGWGTLKVGMGTINYGGRFLGNFFEILLAGSHNQLLNGIFKGAILTFICLMACLISGKVTVTRLIVFNSLFLLTSMRIIYESFLWTAGFVNYTLPFAFVLPVIWINQILRKNKNSNQKFYILKVTALLLIFASGLFLENLSTTFFFYLGTELMLSLIFKEKNRIYNLLCFLSSILSLGVMITHSERFTSKSGYSVTSFHSMHELVQNIKSVHFIIIDNLFHNNVFLLMIVSALLAVFLFRILPKVTDHREHLYHSLKVVQTVLVFLCPSYQLVIVPPLQINDRVFFPSVVVLILSGLVLFGFVEREISNQRVFKQFVVAIFVMSLVFPSLFFIDMARWNARINAANERAITQKVDIDYSKMKPEYYQYYYGEASGPLIAPIWTNWYKVYYKIPEEVTIK